MNPAKKCHRAKTAAVKHNGDLLARCDHVLELLLAASVAIIEASCPDIDDPARQHAAAARAWLEGDPALALEHYGAIAPSVPGPNSPQPLPGGSSTNPA